MIIIGYFLVVIAVCSASFTLKWLVESAGIKSPANNRHILMFALWWPISVPTVAIRVWLKRK